MARDYSSVPEKDLSAGINQQAAEDSIPAGYVEHALNVDFNSSGLVEKRAGFRNYLGNLPIRVAEVEQQNASPDTLSFKLTSISHPNFDVDLSDIPPGPILVVGKTDSSISDFGTTYTSRYYPTFEANPRKLLYPNMPLTFTGYFTTISSSLYMFVSSAVYYSFFYSSTFRISLVSSPGTYGDTTFTTVVDPLLPNQIGVKINSVFFISGTYSVFADKYPLQASSTTFTQAEHGFSSSDYFVGVAKSTSQTNKNNEHIFITGAEINKTTYDATLPYQLGGTESLSTFIYGLEMPTIAGSSYTATFSGVSSITILGTTHNLNTYNILCRVYKDNTTSWEEVVPNTMTLDENNGDIALSFSETGTYKVLLYAVPATQQYVDSLGGNVSSSSVQGQFEIPDIEGDFLFLDCYTRNESTNILTKIMPEEVKITALENKATVYFSNNTPIAEIVVFYWEYAKIKSTTLTVTPANNVTTNAIDTEPELSIYGLLTEEIFPTQEAPRSGWVQHIDTYKSEGFNTVIAGMGWNLFQAVEHVDAASYLQTTIFYPSLRARARTTIFMAPLFHEPVSSLALINRTRGAITFEGGASGWAILESIQWSEASQGYWVTVNTPARLDRIKQTDDPTPVDIPLLQTFTDTTRWGDLLSMRGAELRNFDGDWPIWQVDYSLTNKVRFLIKPDFTSADYDCAMSGEAGVFTDRFIITHRPLLTRGDTVFSGSFPEGTQLGYIGSDRSTEPYLYVSGVVEELQVANGQLILFERDTKYCYGPRTIDGQQRSFVLSGGLNFAVLRGDSIIVTGRPEPVEVAYVVSKELTNITASVTDEVLTLTGVTNARQFSVGQKILLQDLGYDAQEFEVTEIGNDNTSLTLAAPGVSDLPALSSCKILPQFMFREIVSIADNSFNSNTFTIEGRWEAIEKPQIDSGNLTTYNAVNTRMTEHFKADDYGSQSLLRSTMSQNNLYLTNGKDPVMKFDGANLYRAGIPRWNPQLFVRLQTGDGKIATGGTCWYYFRIGGIDANGNEVISAATGTEDYKVTIVNGTSIHLRLLGFPVWDNYDYEKLTIQIYRTALFAETPIAPFYLVGELEMPQTIAGGYVDFVDSEANDTITKLSTDAYVLATAGDEGKATTLSEPLRAKYITSLNNRIVLGNIRGYQQMDLRFIKANEAIKFSDFINNTFTLHKNAQNQTLLGIENKITIGYVGSHLNITNKVFGSGATANVLTITLSSSPGYTPALGDWVYLTHTTTDVSSSGATKGIGWYQISGITSATTFSIYMPNDGTDTTKLGCDSVVLRTSSMSVGTVPVYLKDDDKVFLQNGGNDDNVLTITNRTAAAINSVMCQVNTNISGQSTFKPWIMADAGGEFALGSIRFRRPSDASSFAFVITTDWSTISVVYTGIQYNTIMNLFSEAPVFPSRIIYSFPNFPELFNKPTQRLITPADDDSNLPIDVNSADGQEITGIIPFFGESAFGQAARESLLVVFKTNSIYLVNIKVDKITLIADNEIQKIESQGLGCTAPYSIAATKDGIMFANESGIYKLTRQLTIEPVGQYVDRIWREEIDLDQLTLSQGHHFGVGRQYKLSVPLRDATKNSDVLVYEHTRESRGQLGPWGRYDNHEVTGWANLFDNEFFATTNGRVCIQRTKESKWGYSDRGTAIVANVELRANDLGIPNIRKKLLHLSVHFRNPQENTVNISQESTTVAVATDLTEDFLTCDEYKSQGLFSRTALSDKGVLKGESVRFSVPTSKAVQYQVKIENNSLYETLQFSGVTYRVSALTTKGTKEAEDTAKK